MADCIRDRKFTDDAVNVYDRFEFDTAISAISGHEIYPEIIGLVISLSFMDVDGSKHCRLNDPF